MQEGLVELSVEFSGLRFLNPFVLPSAQATRTEDMVVRALAAGWAGAVMPTVTPDNFRFEVPRPGLKRVRFRDVDLGIGNVEPTSDVSLLDMAARIKRLAETGRPIIGSFSGPHARGPWVDAGNAFRAAGASAIELNLSTPHALPEAGLGAAIGVDPQRVYDVVNWTTAAAGIPVWVKLPPLPHVIVDLAEASAAAGASAVTLTNNLPGILGMDLETGALLPNAGGHGQIGAIAGPALTPVSMACVALVAKARPDLDIAACGGVVDVDSALAFVQLGAGLLQIYTPVLEEGHAILPTLMGGVGTWLQSHGRSITDLRRSSPYVRGGDVSAPAGHETKAAIDDALCIRCGRCVVSCADAAYQAIDGIVGVLPHVRQDACTGCGLCEAICPVPGAIVMRRRPEVARPSDGQRSGPK